MKGMVLVNTGTVEGFSRNRECWYDVFSHYKNGTGTGTAQTATVFVCING